jgi:hypothetical protein
MVNPGEASLNAVTPNKPKMLLRNGSGRTRLTAASASGLGQKARGQVRKLRSLPTRMLYHQRRDAT